MHTIKYDHIYPLFPPSYYSHGCTPTFFPPNCIFYFVFCFVFDDSVKHFCFVLCAWVWDSQIVLVKTTTSDILKNRIMSPSWATIHCQWLLSRMWSLEVFCPIYDRFRLAWFCVGLLHNTTAVVNLCLNLAMSCAEGGFLLPLLWAPWDWSGRRGSV